MGSIFEFALNRLERGERCVLAVITDNFGSTPRDRGAVMLMGEDETITGTIGGGPMEFEAYNKARELVKVGGVETFHHDATGADTSAPDAICGGKANVCLYTMDAKDVKTAKAFCDCFNSRVNSELVLWQENGVISLVASIPGGIVGPEGVDIDSETVKFCTRVGGIHSDERLLLCEPQFVPNRVWFIGAGHVCQATAKIAAMAHFEVAVWDDRAEYANEERFPDAKNIVVGGIDTFSTMAVSENDYIVIATHGHRDDREALEWALTTPACYVGMIGSLPKRNKIYERLESEGVSRERLEWVHSPIGIKLGGRTPEEIGVSIVAELIKVRTDLSKKATVSHGDAC